MTENRSVIRRILRALALRYTDLRAPSDLDLLLAVTDLRKQHYIIGRYGTGELWACRSDIADANRARIDQAAVAAAEHATLARALAETFREQSETLPDDRWLRRPPEGEPSVPPSRDEGLAGTSGFDPARGAAGASKASPRYASAADPDTPMAVDRAGTAPHPAPASRKTADR